ncbi:MAG: tRNA 2-thiouridine(34) synthase MnmA [Chloroflexi bacterium]|nr:tRNA 2-thiouridine(34) synthase MnmA [Chloroflexota bacterium]MCL5273966.1 tRNA 2-thiouridine(34) synthase MnmA [Chloroflexota bacterium]
MSSLSGKTRVVVAMSGGVDSSVAAALLVQQGYEVIGIMLRLWAEESDNAYGAPNANRCCAPEAVADARAIAKQLDIPFYDIHAESVFKQRVVDPWIGAYAEASTPNPCFNCNRSIRFGFLMQRALALGADYLATGHYARVQRPDNLSGGAQYKLLKGLDATKDQSYVLHVLGQRDLARAMFPCGEYAKPQVRELARRFGLPTAERAESMDLCFLTQGDYRGFLARQAPDIAQPGPILTEGGELIGRHDGLPYYTVGQRKGLNLKPHSAFTEPLYVLRLDAARNALIVGTAGQLGMREVNVRAMHYCSDVTPAEPLHCTAKVRYKAREAACVLTPLPGGRAHVTFDEPQRDATPGQGLVAYAVDEVIGGGLIVR